MTHTRLDAASTHGNPARPARSAGDLAQAVAWDARRLGIPATTRAGGA